ncbi:MAG TPA: hypothetical protein VH436_28060 [Vicinamibacterales bacterium]|jgi:hypothetical protein
MMYATVFSWVRQSRSISRPARLIAGLAAACVLACTNLRSAEPLDFARDRPWREAPEYLRLFAPDAHRDHYRAYVSPLGLDETLAALMADPAVQRPPGGWEPRQMIAFDAFGRSGSYNRWKLAGLYGSRRARVARGPRVDHGQSESWMLVAPYPDPALQHLEPGTLIIVLKIPPA